ncbi:hypothetical protein Q31b_02820 [Novipirellula aureliae]|uniref:Carboxypeptidase regulatory-like domain-containing protein n=1 Tax=Novipirellula aureliae TaxID=2527966 RepID=A0A5C6EBG7_9BACT|nr:hypothetical protein [Novipirellula aureliae]TWU45111.1 hypothetical protein Q31b_02820 [Novipirellula aureliae]
MKHTNHLQFHVSLINAVAFAALIFPGCSESKPIDVDLYPVVGTVLLDGQPAVGATLKFIPVDSDTGTADSSKPKYRRAPAATVDANGRFQASFDGIGDGAPLGTYKVVVFMLQTPEGGGFPTDRFGGKYLDESKPVAMITVTEGDNDCGVIELKST